MGVNIQFNPPNINFQAGRKTVKTQIVAETKNFFAQHPNYTPAQKSALDKRLHFIVKQAEQNAQLKDLPKTDQELQAYCQSISDIVLSVNSNFKIPECKQNDPAVQAVYRMLMSGDVDWKNMLDSKILSALFVRKNPALLLETRVMFQKVMKEMASQFDNLSHQEQFSAQAIISNLLCYYTYFDPQNGEKMRVPQLINGNWQMVDYTVETISLTPSALGSPITAFGLMPDDKKSPPLLLFKGTTFPTDKGCCLELLADMNPGSSVGAYPFKMGKTTLQTWLNQATQTTGTKARICGQSLGGSLTLHTVSNFPQLVGEAWAVAPTALHESDLKIWDQYVAQNPGNIPRVEVLCQENDPVPKAGLRWGQGWNITHIFAADKKAGYFAHVMCYFSQTEHVALKGDLKSDEKKPSRYFMAIAHLILSIPLFISGVMLYSFYLAIRKTVEAACACFRTKKPPATLPQVDVV